MSTFNKHIKDVFRYCPVIGPSYGFQCLVNRNNTSMYILACAYQCVSGLCGEVELLS
jgi:hypothetical protein